MPQDGQPIVAPYLKWAIRTGFAYLRGEWFRVLLEVEGTSDSFAVISKPEGLADLIRVPSIYGMLARTFEGYAKGGELILPTFCTAIMTKKALAAMFDDKVLKGADAESFQAIKASIKRIELCTPIKKPYGRSPLKAVPKLSATRPRSVVVAVIDDGLAFAHRRFRYFDAQKHFKTRFKYFWNQDDTSGINPALGFGYGRELPEGEINTLLDACTQAGNVDEERFYRLAGQQLVARRVKHGTHVMDIACGLDPEEVTSRSPHLIGIQLPRWVTEDTSGALLTAPVTDAISFILDRADRIAAAEGTGPLPVVVNISYGTIAGPHDGTGQFETVIDQFIQARSASAPLAVVLPAGNHYLARCHARFRLPGASSKELRWRVQPDDKAASFMEIWLPELDENHARPILALRITTPDGEVGPWITPGQDWYWPNPNFPNVRFSANYIDTGAGRPWILLSMAPTTQLRSNPRTAPSGTWLVEIRNQAGAVKIEAWVQRGDTPLGYPLFGRQSRFDDENYRRFDLAGRPWEVDNDPSYIRRMGSLNALATGQRSAVVGGYRRSDKKASRYSGAGPTATPMVVPPPRTGPDASGVADNSAVMHGLLGAGTRTGSVVAINGTSVAAPRVTRRISELMTLALASDRNAVEQDAINSDPLHPAPNTPQMQRLGAGRFRPYEPVELRWKLRS